MDSESAVFWRNLETVTRSAISDREIAELRVPSFTILAHPEVRRIGERSILTALASAQEVTLSRLEPLFAVSGDSRRRPLADPHLSRRPLKLVRTHDGTVRLLKNGIKTRVEADGVEIEKSRDFSVAEIERGIVLTVADRIVLLFHLLDPPPPEDLPHFDLVGENVAMVTVRQQIARAAELVVPTLVRGETGTGKELVASAIHRASPRRSRPFVVINMSAIAPALAAAELFGVAKGALPGADRERLGYFARVGGGTLLLDDVGETPLEVQGLLLRTLETGLIQPVGSDVTQKIDVRIIAAANAHLEAEIKAGRFRAPFLHRLRGYEIRLPPVSERRDDLGRLLIYFLRKELETLGETWRLDAPNGTARPWLPAAVVARLATYSWPGNVRQLRNVACQLVADNRGASELRITPQIEALLEVPNGASSQAGAVEVSQTSLDDLGDSSGQALLRTLLLTDLVASTRLVERLGDERTLAVMTRHDREARRLLGEYDGHEIDKSDGFLFLFKRPADALGYALEYHQKLAALSDELGVELAARAGIHLGHVFVRRNAPDEVARGAKAIEVEGLAKPIAARLMSLAGGGQTLLTRNAFDLAQQVAQGDHPLAATEVRWLAHGNYRFKGIRAPVEVFEVGAEGVAPLEAPTGSRKVERAEET